MSGRYLLDSNIVIELLRGDQAVEARLANEPETFLSVVVLGELYFGARKSHQVDRNVSRIEELAGSVSVLGCEHETSRRYGVLKRDSGCADASFLRTTSGSLPRPSSTA